MARNGRIEKKGNRCPLITLHTGEGRYPSKDIVSIPSSVKTLDSGQNPEWNERACQALPVIPNHPYRKTRIDIMGQFSTRIY